jgi:hypothetical protein
LQNSNDFLIKVAQLVAPTPSPLSYSNINVSNINVSNIIVILIVIGSLRNANTPKSIIEKKSKGSPPPRPPLYTEATCKVLRKMKDSSQAIVKINNYAPTTQAVKNLHAVPYKGSLLTRNRTPPPTPPPKCSPTAYKNIKNMRQNMRREKNPFKILVGPPLGQ